MQHLYTQLLDSSLLSLQNPPDLCPHARTFFTMEMVKEAIDRMTRKVYDHERLVAEHLILAKDTRAELLAMIFRCSTCEGLGHSIVWLYESILNHQLRSLAEGAGL
ncbi:hypothetical protein KP509_19G056800 [Ceratopteris richardii]|uniref:Uncharacterized protein n=1 Tax=Ceratopteris richardii TaxID=49495 RepID=A0A8T2SPS2_CERRI|nr:hypothetical protein KP509_19G056800 [Ceratopteris richardii]